MTAFAKNSKTLALAITSIPVLTGDAAEKFERHAQQNYQSYLHRTKEQKEQSNARYEQGMKMVQEILAKSKLRAK